MPCKAASEEESLCERFGSKLIRHIFEASGSAKCSPGSLEPTRPARVVFLFGGARLLESVK